MALLGTKSVERVTRTIILSFFLGCGGGDDTTQAAGPSTAASGSGGGGIGGGAGQATGGGAGSGGAVTSSGGSGGQTAGASMTGGAGGTTPDGGGPDAPSGTCPAGAVFCEDFESGTTSKWFLSGGSFIVSSDGSKVLRMDAGNGASSLGYSIARGWGDQTVEGRFKVTINASLPSYRVGIAARCPICYGAVVDNTHNLLLVRGMDADGMPSTAASCAARPVQVTEGQWFTVRMRVSGMGPVNSTPVHVETWVNGQPVHDCMDKTMVNATGGVGILATGVSVVTEFDDIWVTTP